MKHLSVSVALLSLAVTSPAAAAGPLTAIAQEAWPAWAMSHGIVWGILAVALLQLCVLLAQGWLLFRSPRAARLHLVSSERPRLSVRQLSLDAFASGEPARVRWNVANIGEAAGRIIETNATILIARIGKLPALPVYHQEVQRAGVTVQPGLSAPFVKFGHEPVTAWEVDAVRRSGDSSLYFFGYVLYSDNTGVLRRTAFCRQFDVKSERFLVVDDPNYEQDDSPAAPHLDAAAPRHNFSARRQGDGMIDPLGTAIHGLLGAEQRFGAAAGTIVAAPPGADLAQSAVALIEAKTSFAANIATLKAAESLDKHLLDIIA